MSVTQAFRPNPYRYACLCRSCTSYITYDASIKRQLAKRGTPGQEITTALKVHPRFFLGYAIERMELTGGRLICALLWRVFVGQKPITGTLVVKMPSVCVNNKPEVPLNNGRTIQLINPDQERE